MDRKKLLNGRFSLSTSNLSATGAASGPSAESTHISNLYPNFSWDRGNSQSPTKYSNTMTNRLTHTTKNKSLAQKIDPRIYTDIQSKGLASRIVKYHESPSRINRSVSVTNLYNKPGQFPVVHLKKNDIPYVASRNQKSVSMVRIAPPEKSIFQANTRASILRSGSIVPTVVLKKSDDEISRENRPILHPAVEHEVAPTRSVLDDLKEISRKRINSDELDSNDTMKKYCKESGNYVTVPAVGTPQQTITPAAPCFENVPSKRQRENPLSPTNVGYLSSEQNNIKRRMYTTTYNNDITSSLSSSLSIMTPKRKLNRVNSLSPEQNSPAESPQAPSPSKQRNPKQLCRDNNFSEIDTKKIGNSNLTQINVTTSAAASTVNRDEFIGDGVFNRSIADKTPFSIIENAVVNQKPKLTLFNKKYEETVTKSSKSRADKESRDELSGISFVTPKSSDQDADQNSQSGLSFLIEKTQKSKLALMLSGLRGDLDIDFADEVDSNVQSNDETTKAIDDVEPLSKLTASEHVSVVDLNKNRISFAFGTTTTVATKTISSPNITTINSNISPSKTVSDVNTNQIQAGQLENNLIGGKPNEKIGANFFASPPKGLEANPGVTNQSTLLAGESVLRALNEQPKILEHSASTAFIMPKTVVPTTAATMNFGLSLVAAEKNSPTAISTSSGTLPTFNFGPTPVSEDKGSNAEKQNSLENKSLIAHSNQFLFGDKSKINNSEVNFGQSLAVPEKQFSFGNKLESSENQLNSIEKLAPGTKQFNFGVQPSTTSIQIGLVEKSKIETAPTSFGDKSTSSNTQLSFGVNSKPPDKPQFNFGEKTLTTNTSSQFNLRQKSTEIDKQISFGAPSTATNTPINFGTVESTMTATAADNQFSFGGNTTASSGVPTTSAFASTEKETTSFLGKKDTAIVNNSAFSFGTKTGESDQKSSGFQFGNNTMAPPSKFNATITNTSSAISVFGSSSFPESTTSFKQPTSTFGIANTNLDDQGTGPNNLLNAPTNVPQSNTFSFNNDKPATTNNIFGGGAYTQDSTFSFGGSKNTQVPESQNASVFGTKNIPATQNTGVPGAFAGSNNTSGADGKSATFSPFSFTNAANTNLAPATTAAFPFNAGATNAIKSSEKNIFESAHLTNNAFTFGSGAMQTANPAAPSNPSTFPSLNNTQSFTFGSAVTQGTGKGFTFGEVANGTENKPALAFNTAGGSDVNRSSTFDFGNNSAPTNNIPKSTSAFSFGAANKNTNTAEVAPFAFGGAAAPMNSNQSSSLAPPNNVAFNFGDKASLNGPSAFGSPAANIQKPSAFSFGGNNTQPNAPNNLFNTGATAAPPVNLFAPTPNSTPASSERLIRKATRRLHK